MGMPGPSDTRRYFPVHHTWLIEVNTRATNLGKRSRDFALVAVAKDRRGVDETMVKVL